MKSIIKIAIGADHRGFLYKKKLMQLPDFTWIDKGTFDEQKTDYPLFAQAVVSSVLKKEANYGVLLCGSGIGMSIAANRHKGIYAALVWNNEIAVVAKED